MSNGSSDRHWRLDAAALERIAAHVRGRVEKRGFPGDAVPTAAELQILIEESFWASIIPDEGRYTPFSLLFTPPEACTTTFPLEPVLASAENIARLAPLLKPRITRLGVARSSDGGLQIWGVVADVSTHLEVRGVAPGRVAIQLGWENLAVVTGEEVTELLQTVPVPSERGGLGRPQAAYMVGAQFGATQRHEGRQVLMGIILLMVAESMRAQGNGGTIVVVPSTESPVFRRLKPGRYRSRGREGTVLSELLDDFAKKLGDREPLETISREKEFSDLDLYLRGTTVAVDPVLRAAADAVGQLTAIDGAVVLTERLQVVAFGATIIQPAGERDQIDRRRVTDLTVRSLVDISSLGGTRKQSAARLLVNNEPDPVVLVASHDGPLYAATWALAEPGGPIPLWITGLEMLLD